MTAPDREESLRALYRAFNARDIDTVLAAMTPDVDWPNGWEGGRLQGKDAVRDYWTRQWQAVDSSVEPAGFETLPDGRVAARVHQLVKDLDGNTLDDREVTHTYTFRDGLVTRMDIAD